MGIEQVPPRHLPEFLLPANLKYVPDILVIATQETFPEKTEWEVGTYCMYSLGRLKVQSPEIFELRYCHQTVSSW